MMVSFDITSLFAKVPVPEAPNIIKEKLCTDSSPSDRTNLSLPTRMDLLRMCLESTYFIHEDMYYHQSEGAAMGSPLSPIIANIFMEYIIALDSTSKKPSL